MITSLKELIAFTTSLAEKIPELRDRTALQQPGCSQDDLDNLARELPGIPHNYLSILKSLRLDGIAIGYFQLSPQSFNGDNMIEKLITCNKSAANPLRERYKEHGVYQVGSWEDDPVCVVYRHDPFKKGQVVKYNIEHPDALPAVLGDSFEQFLLIAGNLDAIRDMYSESDNPKVGIDEFRICLAQLASDRIEIIATWNVMAAIVLS